MSFQIERAYYDGLSSIVQIKTGWWGKSISPLLPLNFIRLWINPAMPQQWAIEVSLRHVHNKNMNSQKSSCALMQWFSVIFLHNLGLFWNNLTQMGVTAAWFEDIERKGIITGWRPSALKDVWLCSIFSGTRTWIHMLTSNHWSFRKKKKKKEKKMVVEIKALRCRIREGNTDRRKIQRNFSMMLK